MILVVLKKFLMLQPKDGAVAPAENSYIGVSICQAIMISDHQWAQNHHCASGLKLCSCIVAF